LVKRACTMPVSLMSMPIRRPVVKPSWVTEFTEKLLPNCVDCARSTVTVMSAAPVAGV
jgi:hypothetical protein